jgi:ankyrin repeat protein
MERVQGQKKGFRDLAIQALLWITCTKRPLAKLELQHALATTENASSIDKGNITEVELIVSVCAGLITVDEESGIIRLIHYTTQDFFERTQKPYFMNAQEQIARTCITYLSFDEFGSGFCKTDHEFETRKDLNPLYNYAAHYWGDHTKGTLLEEGSLILSFLDSQAKVDAASQTMFSVEWPEWPDFRGYSQRFPKGLTGLHLAAHLGLSNTAIILLRRGSCLNAQNGDGGTPLWMAASTGQDAVVKLLLAESNIDCDSGDIARQPLSIAAENGHASVVELFLANSVANPNSTDGHGRTPLAWAARNGHRDVVRLLLARQGIQADLKDMYGVTPLWLAASYGHKAVVELLLGIEGVDLDAPGISHQTPLSAAAGYGYEDVVSLLITCGDVNVNVKDKDGRTSLFLASKNGHESVVKLLLTYDNVDRDASDTHGFTPLSVAAARGCFTIVESLLKAGADPTLKDHYGWTPFLWASVYSHRNVMHLLQATDDARGNGKQQKAHKQGLPTAHTSRNDSLFKDYYIAWICALPGELAAARGMLDVIHVDLTKHPKDDYVYLLGCISSHNIVVACRPFHSKVGESLEIGSRILRTFTSVRAALLVGIDQCAPTKEHDIRLGDVVVGAGSRGLVQYGGIDSHPRVTPICPPSTFLTAITALESGSLIPAFITEMGAKHPSMSANFTSRPKQSDQLFEAGSKCIGDIGNCEKSDVTQLISRPPRIENQPVIHYGNTFADSFLMRSGRTKEAVSMNFDALCFETDTYGWSENFPVLEIRGIWNCADIHTNGSWREYAAATAAAYAKELLRKVPLEDILEMQALTIALTNRDGDANGWCYESGSDESVC